MPTLGALQMCQWEEQVVKQKKATKKKEAAVVVADRDQAAETRGWREARLWGWEAGKNRRPIAVAWG